MLDSKFKRVLFHLGTNLITLIVMISLMNGEAFANGWFGFSVFLLIIETVWYFLYDRKNNEGLIARIIYFIVMGILLLITLVAMVSGISEASNAEGTITLAQYAALATTPIALAVSAFAFMIIDNHFSDADYLYPFVPAMSCLVGYLLGLAVCAVGYAVPFMFVGGGFIFLLLAIVAYIIYVKKTDLPLAGYTGGYSSGYTYSGTSSYKPSYPTASTSSSTTSSSTSTTKPSGNSDRSDFIRDVKYHCHKYVDVKCCGELVTMSATVEAVVNGDTITIEATRTDVDTYRLEGVELSQSKAMSYKSEFDDRLYHWKLDINREVDRQYKTLEIMVDKYNSTHSNGFNIESYHVS